MNAVIVLSWLSKIHTVEKHQKHKREAQHSTCLVQPSLSSSFPFNSTFRASSESTHTHTHNGELFYFSATLTLWSWWLATGRNFSATNSEVMEWQDSNQTTDDCANTQAQETRNKRKHLTFLLYMANKRECWFNFDSSPFAIFDQTELKQEKEKESPLGIRQWGTMSPQWSCVHVHLKGSQGRKHEPTTAPLRSHHNRIHFATDKE